MKTIALLYFLLISKLVAAETPKACPHLHYKGQTKRSALILHGLNLKSSRMGELADILREKGHTIVLPTLAGHGDDYQEFTRVSADIWRKQTREAFCEALALLHGPSDQLTILAYSLGGALALELAQYSEAAQVDTWILLSPAIHTRWFAGIPGTLAPQFRHWGIPSMNHENYRAHAKTTVAAYESLGEISREAARDWPPNDSKVLVAIDPSDELVSAKKTLRLAKNTGAQTLEVSTKKCALKSCPHHLIVARETLKEGDFDRLSNAISFLFPKP
jgi:esterase/lipase